MNLGGNILLWAGMVWLPVLLCALMVRDGKPRKNMAVGVTLPYSLLADPAVERLLLRERDGDIFLFGGSDPRETEAVFEEVRIPQK